MADVKIRFSENELHNMRDTSFLLSKRIITQKVCDLFSALADEMKNLPEHRNFPFPEGADYQRGKISKGENYKGLPFVMLDFPRLFEKENVFAFRTMFWWGGFFSFMLHLKGKPMEAHVRQIIKNRTLAQQQNLLVYSGNDEWTHDLEDAGYVSFKTASDELLLKMNFFKIGRKLAIDDYENVTDNTVNAYRFFLKMMSY